MKVLLSWLRDYVDIPSSVDGLAERFEMLGLGVEGLDRFADDAVFDLELPANRGDLMSLVGVAREVAASLRGSVRSPIAAAGGVPRLDAPTAGEAAQGVSPVSGPASVEVHDPELCPRYTATMVLDVTVGPSPQWMAHRLDASGIRSINSVVDVTNYVMLELGQPLHAFDYDRLGGRRVIVRRAHDGERLVTLDGIERDLSPQTLVIADSVRAVGVAGVIGGADSEIGSATSRVLLEAAAFAPASIRRTSKRLGVRTESSARFERGIDIAGVPAAAARAAGLLREVAGGRVLPDVVDVYPHPVPPRTLDLRWTRVARLLGVDIPMSDGEVILVSLGFTVARTDGVLRVGVPSHRRDVEREEDLIEDVARHYGYEHIPEAMPVERTATGTRAPVLVTEEAARSALIRAGLTEVLTVSITDPESLDVLRLPAAHPWRQAVRLKNPLVGEQTQMRTTLLPGLLETARTNISRRVHDVQVFELGRVFLPRDGRVAEPRRLGILMTGSITDGTWNSPAESLAVTFYHLKGVAEALVAELRVAGAVFDAGQAPWLHPGRAAVLRVAGDSIGLLGELHPDIAVAFDVPAATYVAEFDLDRLLAESTLAPQYRPLPRYPAVRRDLAVVVDEQIPAQAVADAIAGAGRPLLESVELFDVYTGAQIPIGRRSLAYALTFRSPDRTLSAGDVDVVIAAIRAALERDLQAQVRD
ncbi:MAG TPA: phenylalanine--tRNA ligase subunit beta [bacterium]|nr:phenylalanine--tRNA ligase subunit beta [bacterium]